MKVNFNNKIVNIKLEDGTETSIVVTSGEIIKINGEDAIGRVTTVKVISGNYKGERLWFDFLYLLTSNLMDASKILQNSFRPVAYLMGNNDLEKSAIVSFHFI
jgi:hypothetical protein